MKNKDILQRFLFENHPIRGEVVHVEQSFQTIMNMHAYPEPIRQLLGEALVIASLLVAILKFKGRLTVQFQAKDKLKLLLAQCNDKLELRGLAQWEGNLSYKELIHSLKNGTLIIMMDPDDSTQRYQGVVEWQGNSITESIEAYFQHSEQLQTRLWLAINDKKAAGFMIQLMPQNKKKKNSEEAMLSWEHIVHLTQTIKADELLDLENETLLHRLYSQEDVRLFAGQQVTFRCTCSMERGENAILLLGREAVEEELHERQMIVVKCEFCSSEYTFDRIEVAKIFNKYPPASSTQIH